MFSATTMFQQETGIQSTEIDGEIVLMSCQTDSYYSLAGPAASIWKAIGTGAAFSSICDSLRGEYTVDEETCRCDVSGFLETLGDQKLIRTAGAA